MSENRKRNTNASWNARVLTAFSSLWSYLRAYPFNALTALLLSVWTQTVLFGWGGTAFTDWRTGQDHISAVTSLLILFFVLLRLTHARSWWFGTLSLGGLSILLGFLTPFYAMTASPLICSQHADTLLASDLSEAVNFITAQPIKSWDLGAGLTLVAFFLLYRIFGANGRDVKNVSAIPLRNWARLAFLSLLLIPAVTPVNDVSRGIYTLVKLSKTLPAPTWTVTGRLNGAPQIQTYILFMSESLSPRVMSLYGAPFSTTPFLDNTPTKRIETMVSPSLATAASVLNSFALSDPKDPLHPHYENNIIALAKQAGLKTYWVSAQGRVGAYEGGISFIASQADVGNFTARHDDFALALEVEKILAVEDNQPRLIVVHGYGAHERVCDRVSDMDWRDISPFATGIEFLDCYLAAARKEDEVLRRIVTAVQKTGQPYSVLFTSDHAINMRVTESGEFVGQRNSKHKGQYEVPFVALGSNVKTKEVVRHPQTLLNFPAHFAAWIGVTTNKTPDGYDLFAVTEPALKVIRSNGEMMPYAELTDSPSVSEMLEKVFGHPKRK